MRACFKTNEEFERTKHQCERTIADLEAELLVVRAMAPFERASIPY
jgi:hypothetical protein